MLVKNPDFPVEIHVHFKRFKFEAFLHRTIFYMKDSEIRHTCLGADAGEFVDCKLDFKVLIWIFIFPCLYLWRLELADILLLALVRAFFII